MTPFYLHKSEPPNNRRDVTKIIVFTTLCAGFLIYVALK